MKVEWWLPEMAAWGWGAENTALLFNEYRASDWGERKVLGVDSDDGCTIM